MRASSQIPRTVRPAFTLIELMVVVGIIVLLVAITIPAIGPLLRSNEKSQVINTLRGLAATAQVAAEANGSPVGIRISRAYTIKSFKNSGQSYQGILDLNNASDKPTPLSFQQARLVRFSSQPVVKNAVAPGDEPFTPAFEDLPDSRPVSLPSSAWVAPIECIDTDANGNPEMDPADPTRLRWDFTDQLTKLRYQPKSVPNYTNGTPGIEINRMDTFCIVFDRFGGLRQLETSPASDIKTRYWYRDRLQPQVDTKPDTSIPNPPGPPLVYPLVDFPDKSARGVLVYDRARFLDLPTTDNGKSDMNNDQTRRGFLMKSTPVYISRSIGEVVEGRQ